MIFRCEDLAFYQMGRLRECNESTKQQRACKHNFKHDFWFNSDESMTWFSKGRQSVEGKVQRY